MPKIEVIQGDITKVQADAIVNAANPSLLGGGGVDGAIHRAGGAAILAECRSVRAKYGCCPAGEAVITNAGNLPARFVIHAVGPVWAGGTQDEARKLEQCYTNSLTLAVENGCKTIAFPCISTGVYAFPKQAAAEIAVQAIRNFLQHHHEIDRVIIVCYGGEDYQIAAQVNKC